MVPEEAKAITHEAIARALSPITDRIEKLEGLARGERSDESMAKQLQRSIEINSHLRRALTEAAQRLEARGHHFGASEARRVLMEL